MRSRFHRHAGPAALVLATVAIVASFTGAADAARNALVKVSAKPVAGGVLKLSAKKQFPASVIPTVARANRADRLGTLRPDDVTLQCSAQTVDLGTWCLMASPFPLTAEQLGKNDYFFASQTCVEQGGYLPTAAQLIGAADRVKLASTVDDSELTASIDMDPTDGLKDRREISSTLITTQAGASAAGSQGVSDGAKGDPKTGEPNPTPLPAVPSPETLQYVTVYDNHDKGGFAGSKPVGQPELFRCAFPKGAQGAQADIG